MSHCDAAVSANQYALVTYVPGPLGRFLDRVRNELVACAPPSKAHVTVLPPRPVSDPAGAWRALVRKAEHFSKFLINLTNVEVFEGTSVIYLAIGLGRAELERMHESLNVDATAFYEPYPYHPHVTLAQGLEPNQVDRVYAKARDLWSSYSDERAFEVQSCHWVRKTATDDWIDLARFNLSRNGMKADRK